MKTRTAGPLPRAPDSAGLGGGKQEFAFPASFQGMVTLPVWDTFGETQVRSSLNRGRDHRKNKTQEELFKRTTGRGMLRGTHVFRYKHFCIILFASR